MNKEFENKDKNNNDVKKEDNKNPHKHHRSRLKKLFLNEGLCSFPDHNILELLLFYSIPQKDTNEIAHALLDKFGSLCGVFDASFEELCRINGISEHSATLIKLIPQLSSAYSLDKLGAKTDFTDLKNAAQYLIEYYMPKTKECVVLILLDNSGSVLHISEITEGVVNMTQIEIRKIAELAFLYNASAFILAHNHPNGKARASKEDVDFTINIFHIFETLGLRLIDHIVVAGNKYQCILKDISKLKW